MPDEKPTAGKFVTFDEYQAVCHETACPQPDGDCAAPETCGWGSLPAGVPETPLTRAGPKLLAAAIQVLFYIANELPLPPDGEAAALLLEAANQAEGREGP